MYCHCGWDNFLLNSFQHVLQDYSKRSEGREIMHTIFPRLRAVAFILFTLLAGAAIIRGPCLLTSVYVSVIGNITPLILVY